MAWTIQTYFVIQDFSEIQTTTIWVLLNLTVALSSLFSNKLEKIFGIKPMILMIVILVPFGYFALGIPSLVVSLLFAFLFYFVRGYATPVLKELIQNYCDTEIRATVLSVRDLLIRLGFTIVGPILGYLSDTYTFSFAVTAAGILFLITALSGYFSYLQLLKYEKTMNGQNL